MPNTAPKAVRHPSALDHLLPRLDTLLDRLERLLPAAPAAPDWQAAAGFRWRKQGAHGVLQAVRISDPIALADLHNIDMQKELVVQNTRQFVQGKPANNVLLTGARGTGKSSLIKACLNVFAKRGLRLIEVDKTDLIDLADIIDLIAPRPERFIIYCDDLSFEEGESGYKALKSALDGSISSPPANLLIYATSNRRHLLPESLAENRTTLHSDDGQVHPGDVIEEKISLSERFGIWANFYSFSQDEYLTICAAGLARYGLSIDQKSSHAALQWARERGARSGRIATQFVRDWVGRNRKAK